MPPMYMKKLNEINKVRGGIFAYPVIPTEPTRKLKVQQATLATHPCISQLATFPIANIAWPRGTTNVDTHCVKEKNKSCIQKPNIILRTAFESLTLLAPWNWVNESPRRRTRQGSWYGWNNGNYFLLRSWNHDEFYRKSHWFYFTYLSNYSLN